MKIRDKIGLIALALACVAYAALRWWRLADSCLWFDEIFTVHAAEMGFSDLLWFVAQDLIHPPLSYLLLKIWILVGGAGLVWVRLFPVFFALLGLYPLIRWCRVLKLENSTIAAAVLFLAVNGCLIKYAQEVRMYSVVFFLALVSMWLFARFLHLGKNIWMLTIVNILLVYTHYFGWLLILSEIAAILALQRIKIRQSLIMFGITLVSFAPWIFAVRRAAQVNDNLGQNIGWIAKPDAAALWQFFLDLTEPFYFQASSAETTSNYVLSIPVLLLVVAVFVIYLIDWKRQIEADKQNLILLSILTIVPVAAALAASLTLPYSIWGTRHLIFVFAPLAVLFATAATKIKPAPVGGILIGLLVLIFGLALAVQTRRETPVYIWCAWENLAQSLDQNRPAKIYVYEDVIAYHLWFALRGTEKNFEIIKVGGVEGLQEDTAYFLPRGFEKVKATGENGITGGRFYVAFRDSAFSEYHPPLKNLKTKGYQIGAPKTFETPGLKGFLVEVWK